MSARPGGPGPCRAFRDTGECRFGDRCRYSHVPGGPAAPAAGSAGGPRLAPCHAFRDTGTCRFGSRCRFSHAGRAPAAAAANDGGPPRASAAPTTAAVPQAGREVAQFLADLPAALRRRRGVLEGVRDRGVWLAAWAAVGAGASAPATAALLLRVMLQAPDSAALAPPPAHVLAVALRVAQDGGARTRRGREEVVANVALVVEVVERRLLGRGAAVAESERVECAALAVEARSAAHTALLAVMGDIELSGRASQLLAQVLGLLERFRVELERGAADHADGDGGGIGDGEGSGAVDPQLPVWAGWRDAKLSWLQRGEWLDSPQLLARYGSVEEYAETVRHMFSMLTFYWGAGAVFPRCHNRGGGDANKPCGEPLCTYGVRGRAGLCGRRLPSGQSCTEAAQWRCHRSGHDIACGRCVRRMQSALVGKPGSRASTDVYDAVVERETRRRDGFVWVLSQLESRKPPAIAPNWRTSYRLKCSALVAVVRVAASCVPLSPQSKIEWAEVVPVNQQTGSAEDFRERANGRIAIRLLTRSDISSLRQSSTDSLEPGSRLVLIDLQVFVPEVVSVLSTLTDEHFVEHLKDLPFSQALIGAVPTASASSISDDVEHAVRSALESTDIDVIAKLPPQVKSSLCDDLVRLARHANLEGTQLEAFAAALTSSLHCTQGPPGTGKSYTGVAITIALDMIRTAAVRAGNPVGPIVVLSYKNHALDELLLDLLKGFNGRHKMGTGLMRCGKSEHAMLASFGERTSREEISAKERLGDAVAIVRSAQRVTRDWRALRSAALAFNESDADPLHALREWKPSRPTGGQDGMLRTREALVELARLSVLLDKFKKTFSANVEGEPSHNKLVCSSSDAFGMVKTAVEAVHEIEQDVLVGALVGLEAGVEHWREPAGTCRSLFLLSQWLDGSVPPPRCKANLEDGCLMPSRSSDTYCTELHDCKYRIGGDAACCSRRDLGVPYCCDHRCKAEASERAACPFSRLPQSSVCSEHACRVCIDSGCPLVLEKDVEACREHSCRWDTCALEVFSLSLPYCRDHCCKLCRSDGVEAYSIVCVGGSRFCAEHKCIDVGCKNVRMSRDGTQDYCLEHGCILCEGRRARVDPSCSMSRMCAGHRCAHVLNFEGPCSSRRDLITDSRFCVEHTCRFCLKENIPLDRPVIGQPPRNNVCEKHSLCTHVAQDGTMCPLLAADELASFCREHAEHQRLGLLSKVGRWLGGNTSNPEKKVQCAGITTKGKQCKTTGFKKDESAFYCPPHVSQKPFEESSPHSDSESSSGSSATSGVDRADLVGTSAQHAGKLQCRGMAKRGNRCKTEGFVDGGDDFYCPPHLSQKKDASTESPMAPSEPSESGKMSTANNIPADGKQNPRYHEGGHEATQGGRGGLAGAGGSSASAASRDPADVTQSQTGVRCAGKTTKGKDCKSTGLSLPGQVFYCHDHEHQRPETVSSKPSMHEVANASLTKGTVDDDKGEGDGAAPACDASAVATATVVGDTNSPDVSQETLDTCHDDAREVSHESESIAKERVVVATAASDENELRAESLGESTSDTSSSGEGSEDAPERVAFGENPDELDLESEGAETDFEASDPEENIISDQQQHLRDIADRESLSGSESDDDVGWAKDEDIDPGAVESSCADWSWDQTPVQRWRSVAKLLHRVCQDISVLSGLADEHVEMARRESAEAAAYSFKRSRVIGATVVGATRRLHALRACEPFAMIVEEGCEVMEPTLLAVLAQRSLRKLELVGDHQQLPAFVQSCWFSIQSTHPSIKTSLFERLVTTGDRGSADTCTVLDVQRRMRKEISDLTRCEYERTVAIQDHPVTVSQRVGDRCRDAALKVERSMWTGEGSVVPGIAPQVYFWELDTAEGRARVGLSRCNDGEAKACVGLVSWLLQCGVPPSSITVITPYKGQLMNIRSGLRRSGRTASLVSVSTIDRFQGDENDIIILSLVSTKPGNRFVALLNRFIVAMSRARIGFYILGSSGAVTTSARSGGGGPSHWRRLLTELKEELPDGPNLRSGSGRFGKEMKICCPRHDASVLAVGSADGFPLGEEEAAEFCSELCEYPLAWCSHPCQKPCHSPSRVPHTSPCNAIVPRPCDRHSAEPLLCCDLQGEGVLSLRDALAGYECDVVVDYKRPECAHSVELRCHDDKMLLEGIFTPEDCCVIEDDFVHPSCGHVYPKPTCAKRRGWERKAPKCVVSVIHERPCGCKTKMRCHESLEESTMGTPPRCHEAVSTSRPRCSHALTTRCWVADTLLRVWPLRDGESVSPDSPLVVHGVPYGPTESEVGAAENFATFPECLATIPYEMSCGHVVNAKCALAFEYASGARQELPCKFREVFKSPICGHEITSTCQHKTRAVQVAPSIWAAGDVTSTELDDPVSEDRFRGSSRLDMSLKPLSGACKSEVQMLRVCGHTLKLPCSSLFNLLVSKNVSPCRELVTIRRSCGHSYDVPCDRRQEVPPLCEAAVDDVFQYPCGREGHFVRPGSCHLLAKLRDEAEPLCPIEVSCARARCSHKVSVPCHKEKNVTLVQAGGQLHNSSVIESGVDYCAPEVGVPECKEVMSYRGPCGHSRDVPCARAFDFAAHPDTAPPCQEPVEVESPLCGHDVSVFCNLANSMQNVDPWQGTPPARITQQVFGNDSTCPVVVIGEREPAPVSDQHLKLLQCGRTTRIVREACGHEDDVVCVSVHDAMRSPCKHVVFQDCEWCGSQNGVECQQMRDSGGKIMCSNLVEKKCSKCNINFTKEACYKEVANCGSVVRAELPCKHIVSWICGDEEDPRDTQNAFMCLICTRDAWEKALCGARALSGQLSSGERSASEARDEKSAQLAKAAEARLGGRADVLAGTSGFDFAALRLGLVGRAEKIMNSCSLRWKIKESRDECNATSHLSSARKLLNAYSDILLRTTNLLGHAIENESGREICVRPPPRISDVDGSFDIVFEVLDGSVRKVPFLLEDTEYGRGQRASVLCAEAMKANESHAVDGVMCIRVGAAFTYQILEGTAPFRPMRRRERPKRKQKDAYEKGDQKARKLMLAYRDGGYDCVSCESDAFQRIYWESGSILSLCELTVELQRRCLVCFDDFLEAKGWHCPDSRDHFLCRECFLENVQQAAAPGSLSRAVDKNGVLQCPHDGCEAKLEAQILIRQKHDADEDEVKKVFDALQGLRMTAHTDAEVKAALQSQKEQLEAEFVRIQGIKDRDERTAELLRLEIVDQILTLKCPKESCRQAFLDFDGCFALTCHACRGQFCAWCVDHYSATECHHHVAHCPQASARGYFHSFEVFSDHHRSRRRKLIISKLKGEDASARGRVLKSLQTELTELGIRLRESDFS